MAYGGSYPALPGSAQTTDVVDVFRGGLTYSAPLAALSSAGTSVKAYGAVGDGVTDDTAACQLALTAVAAAGGGAVYFPTGHYLISTALVVSSNTKVYGDGASSVIVPLTSWTSQTPHYKAYTDTQTGGGNMVFVNANHGGTKSVFDTNIEISDIAISGQTNGYVIGGSGDTTPYWNGFAVNFRYIYGARFNRVYIFNCGDGIACMGAYDNSGTPVIGSGQTPSGGGGSIIIDQCYAYNAANCAWDFWVGICDIVVRDCTTVLGQTAVNFNAGQFSIANTSAGSNILIEGNRIYYCTRPAIYIDPLTQPSSITTAKVLNNVITGRGGAPITGVPANAIIAGASTDVLIQGNTMISVACGALINVASDVQNSTTYPAYNCRIRDNTFINCTSSGSYITAGGQRNDVCDNRAINSTAVHAVQFDDPSSYYGFNDLPGFTGVEILNASFTTGAATTPAAAMTLNRSTQTVAFNNSPIIPVTSGTFTPVLQFGAAGGTQPTLSVATGSYVHLLGNMVYMDIKLTISAMGTATGNATLQSIPYVPNVEGTITPTFTNSLLALTPSNILGVLSRSSSQIVLKQGPDNSAAALSNANFQVGAQLNLTGWFQATT